MHPPHRPPPPPTPPLLLLPHPAHSLSPVNMSRIPFAGLFVDGDITTSGTLCEEIGDLLVRPFACMELTVFLVPCDFDTHFWSFYRLKARLVTLPLWVGARPRSRSPSWRGGECDAGSGEWRRGVSFVEIRIFCPFARGEGAHTHTQTTVLIMGRS